MELDLQGSKVYLGSCVQRYSLAETRNSPPPPAFGLIYEGAYWSAKIDVISSKPPVLLHA